MVLERAPAIREAKGAFRIGQTRCASWARVERSTTKTAEGRRISVNDFDFMAREAGAHSISPRPCLPAILESGERIEGDFLIGADGISRVIRAGLYRVQPPRDAGYYCWRGIRHDNRMSGGPFVASRDGQRSSAFGLAAKADCIGCFRRTCRPAAHGPRRFPRL